MTFQVDLAALQAAFEASRKAVPASQPESGLSAKSLHGRIEYQRAPIESRPTTTVCTPNSFDSMNPTRPSGPNASGILVAPGG